MPLSPALKSLPKDILTYCNPHEIADFILQCQTVDGAIYWSKDQKLDPWDHTEAAMALSICGRFSAAELAFQWLKDNQNNNGSWYARYDKNHEKSSNEHWKIETNFVAYPATGIWHHYVITQDPIFLERYFPMVKRAMGFIIYHQGEEGEIQWAISKKEPLAKDALITACASILRSLECAINIAETLAQPCHEWRTAYRKLADALRNKPWRFDRTWESKSRYSMDWFYPILAGLFSKEEAQLRLEKNWNKFVEKDLGCRCVADQPWVTTAESCELIIALTAADKKVAARNVFKWIAQWRDGKQGYWTGYNYRDKVIWPKEKTSWTAAAVVLAADALFELTPASGLFTSSSSPDFSSVG